MKLIDKDKVVEAIKKIYNEDYKFLPSDIVEGVQDFKDDLLRTLDTLEVKEVDLEKEYDNFQDLTLARLVNRNAGIVIAKHFFELGLSKSRK